MQRPPALSPLLALAPWVPYAAVLLGLYVLHSAWWALGLYHAGMLAFLLRSQGRPAFRSLVRGFHFRPGMLTIVAWTWRRIAVANGGLAVPWLSHFAGDASFLVAVELLARRGPA